MNCRYILFWISLGLLFIQAGCNQKKQSSVKAAPSKDSVSTWIDQGRNTELSSDSRKNVLNKAFQTISSLGVDSMSNQSMSRLSLAFLDLNDSLGFRKTNAAAMRMSAQIKDSASLAGSHWDLAVFFNMKSVPDSAYYHFYKAKELYHEMGKQRNEARVLYNMAVIQASVKDYTGSELSTFQAIDLLKQLDEIRHLGHCYNNLGSITKELEEYNQAIGYYNQAMVYYRQLPQNKALERSILNNIGVLYQEQGKDQKALEYFDEVLGNYEAGIVTSEYARLLANRAYSLLRTGITDQGMNTFKRAVELQDSLSDLSGLSRSHYNLARYYQENGDKEKALYHVRQAEENAMQSDNNKRLLESIRMLAVLDPENASSYSGRYIELSDSLALEERAIRNKFARIRFETDEFRAQNILLERQRQLWIGIAAGVILLAFAIFIIISQRVKNQKLKFERQQQEANLEIFNLMLAQNQKLEEGKQSEQKRISEELHDAVLGEMNGIRMVLLALNNKSDAASMEMRDKAISRLQELQEEVRTISHELNDASYHKFHNFILSVDELLKKNSRDAGIRYKLSYDEDVDWDDLSGEIKINLYRCLQECIQNAIKHGQASELKLDLQGSATEIHIKHSDNGTGFSPGRGKKGIGHRNIASRVSKIRGSWEIQSSPGTGTTVHLHIPRDTAGIKNKTNAKETSQHG
ncbi:tetratricopeptide repeat protein [Zeaxanthinibacter sp. PT1]|uniref:tetratricopeptide repeat-containing sensor histidine kinase n=1 Tax=Zeaxanthinibacter TaxID=561554 RepID=UPI00234B8184|nr:tetratricopeptide repeat protein [Zeaxanthinibacter sp. PT1]MDC6351712.1 tetratricopeptide repeat protein [Zeaxanthinibacter sp. PT1]